ncbi:hypothetical protein ACIA59_17385 [Micromonospora haikouensis]|uniref:hypothetical protein n=1 Tax=Micromonospora haikouensis TaxID=686309 RepID=UPI0037B9475E
MSGTDGRTPPGTLVRLVIPTATVVAHGNLKLQVTLPGHRDVIHLPLVDEHYQSLVEVCPHVPAVEAGQTWRSVAHGLLLFAFVAREQPDDVGTVMLICADGGTYYTPTGAVDEFGPLELVGEAAPVDNLTPAAVADQATTHAEEHAAGYHDGRAGGLADAIAVVLASRSPQEARTRIERLAAQAAAPDSRPTADTAVMPRVPVDEHAGGPSRG